MEIGHFWDPLAMENLYNPTTEVPPEVPPLPGNWPSKAKELFVLIGSKIVNTVPNVSSSLID
jgi:hypothetical protein